jgi:sulfate transport system permease protein
VRWALIGARIRLLAIFLVLPLVLVFTEALRKGVAPTSRRCDPDALAAIR